MKNLKVIKKWDTHHHISPDFYEEFIKKNGYEDGIYGLPHTKWSEKLMFGWMDSINIEKSFMSISLPGVHFGDDKESREICRRCNNYMAELIKKHPSRLGGFAAIPLPDVNGSRTELEYALDKLKLDGIGIVSNLNDKYYGDPIFEPFWDEVNRRHGVVYVHPRRPKETSDYKLINYPYYIKTDTTRTIVDFMRAGYHKKFPNIKFVLSHGGGILPAVISDVLTALEKENSNIRMEFNKWRGQLFGDIALITYPDETLPTTLKFFGANHIVYGSDLSWTSTKYKYFLSQLGELGAADKTYEDMMINNVKRVFQKKKVPFKPYDIKSRSESRYKEKTNHHVHLNPENVINYVKSNCNEQVDIQHSSEITCNHISCMLSMDIPELWNIASNDVKREAVKMYNRTIVEMKNSSKVNTKVLAAIDAEDAKFSIKEMDYCINQLKMDGICLYVKLTGQKPEDMFDDELLSKLEELNVPVIIHPKYSNVIPTLDINYYDSVSYFHMLLYLDKLEHLKKVNYVPTHTGGLIDFLARPVNTMQYIDPVAVKPRIGKIVWEMVIRKKEVYNDFVLELKSIY